MRSVLRLGAALALASMHVASTAITDDWPTDPKPRKRHPRSPAPNDFGPVIDTTPESKRARRRRLAKQKETA